MSTSKPNESDTPVAEPRNSTMLWVLLLLALIALGLWWYSRQPTPEPVAPPATTDQPAIASEDTAATAADKAAVKKPAAKKPEAKPKPVAKITHDPTPLASNQAPKYPPQALRSGVEGSVSVLVEVDASGVPTDVKVVERSGERSRDLDRAVTDAVRRWRFEPAMKDGKAVPGAVVVPVEFKSQ